MCGRFVTKDQAAMERAWHIGRSNTPNPLAGLYERPRFNIAPQQGNPSRYVPVVRANKDGQPEGVRLQWWLLPFWSKTPRIKYTTFNARVESITAAASFREPFKKRRCLVPVSGWYEWQELPTGNLPWYISPANDEAVMLAGIWERWEHDGEVVESFSLVVGEANGTI